MPAWLGGVTFFVVAIDFGGDGEVIALLYILFFDALGVGDEEMLAEQLAIGASHVLDADVPFVVPLDDGCELIPFANVVIPVHEGVAFESACC